MQIVDAQDHARLSGNPLTHQPKLHRAQLAIGLTARYFLSRVAQIAEHSSEPRLIIDRLEDHKGCDYVELHRQRKAA